MKTRSLLAALTLLCAASIASAQAPNVSSLDRGSAPLDPAPLGGPTCGDFDAYQQPLDAANFNTARTSDEQSAQQVWEDIVDGGGTIVPFMGDPTDGLRVWGLSIEFNGGFVAFCGEDHTALTEYNVDFYADVAGAPAVVPSFSTTAVPTSITDTGIPFAFTTIFEYDLQLADEAPEGYEWISIVRQTGEQAGSGADCYWLWVDETDATTYDNAAFSVANGSEPTDQTLCIGTNETVVPPTDVPTASNIGLLILSVLLAGGAVLVLRRRA